MSILDSWAVRPENQDSSAAPQWQGDSNVKIWQWAGQGGWGQTSTVSGHVARSQVSCEGTCVGTGWGASQGCPSGLCFLEVFGSQDLLLFQLSHTLVLPLGEPSFPQKTAGDREAALAGGGEVIRLSLPMGADR